MSLGVRWYLYGFRCELAAILRCRVQASRLVRSTPPGSTPDHRPGVGVHVKAGAQRSGGQRNGASAPGGFSLDDKPRSAILPACLGGMASGK